MVNIEINGIPLQARDGAMVIEAADEAGITIPRFCYHKKLSVAANCRMCLVEVEKVGKPLPACATPVSEGMRVYTRSPKALSAQKGVMEFLLINHPLDCPICDQGGECDLQEMAMGYGKDISRFSEGKRIVADKNLGPLIATDMTRCIHCTRCVRFGQEIAGMWELGATGRGEHMRIGTYVEETVDSELSGNVIDLCPVGALTSKPYRYTARPWEQQCHASVSPHDSVGTNIDIHVRRNEVMRVLPRENEALNETWLADRDRFAYEALDAEERLLRPMIKKEGTWQESDWDTALLFAVEGLKRIMQEKGADRVGALAGYTASCEEFYLLQKLMRGIGSGNIDHRLQQIDFRDQEALPIYPALGLSVAELEGVDVALLVGSNIRKDQPLLGHRLRKAALAGARVSVLNPIDFAMHFPLAERLITAPAAMPGQLAAIAQVLLEQSGELAPEGLERLLEGVEVAEAHRRMAADLQSAERGVVLLGNLASGHASQAELRALGSLIARLAGVRFGQIAEGGNSAGAWLAGAVPHRGEAGGKATVSGRHWRDMFADTLDAYLLLQTEPERDCADSGAALNALNAAGFVVALSPYASETMREYADVLLPTALYPETSGTYVNAQGDWQSVVGAVAPPAEARPAWKLLRVLGNLFDVAGFEYMSSEEVRDELKAGCVSLARESAVPWRRPETPAAVEGVVRIGLFPLYATDSMVRRSLPLQQTHDGRAAVVRINAATAASHGLNGSEAVRVRQGGGEVVLPLIVDATVAEGCAVIPAGLAETVGLGLGGQAVELEPAGA